MLYVIYKIYCRDTKIKGPLFIFRDVMHRRVIPVSLSCVGRGSVFCALAAVGYNRGKLGSWSGPPVALSGRHRRVIVAVLCPCRTRVSADNAPTMPRLQPTTAGVDKDMQITTR